MEAKHIPAQTANQGLEAKHFSNLAPGDHITTLAEITQIRQDTKNKPPRWVLYYLYDGSAIIPIFQNKNLAFRVGDIVKIDLKVSEGKPYKDRPQLSFHAKIIEPIEKEDPKYQNALQKFAYNPILRKSELKNFPEGTRIKLFTKILDYYPPNGEKNKFQKILVADLDEKPISLWFPKECFPLFKTLTENEYFVLKSIIKVASSNNNARYLSFESFIQGKDAFIDPVAKQFFKTKVRFYSRQLLTALQNWKQSEAPSSDMLDLLFLTLKTFCREMTNKTLL
ncbi:MAG: hypothetical protein ACTSRS_04225 [Candidatus Helarchaeota archaeon]